MIFKDLVDKFSNNDAIFERLFTLHPDSKRSQPGYEKVLKEIRILAPVKTTFKIRVETVEDWYDKSKYTDVSGYNTKDKTVYAIEYSPWAEWLGMTISTKSLKQFSELDIFCECLWEITWSGYNQKEIKKTIDGLMNTVKEIHQKNT